MRLWGALVVLCGCDRAFGLTEQFDAPPADAAADGETPPPPPVDAGSSVIAHYDFETIGDPACLHDASGNGHEGNCIGTSPALVAAKYGMGFSMNRMTRMHVAAPAELSGGAFTIGAWIDYNGGIDGPDGMCVFNKVYGTKDGDTFSACISTIGTTFYFATTEAVSVQTLSYATVTANAWHHLGIVYQPGKVDAYIDGVLQGSGNWTLLFDDGGLELGADADAGTTLDGLNGQIDDAWIVGRALSQDEMVALTHGAVR